MRLLTRSALQVCLAVLLSLAAPLLAQSHGERPGVPLQDLLNGPDRQDFPWKITVLQPRLMYQQRFIVQMRARISAEIVSGHNKHALHFILKVKPQDGDWLKGEQYNDYPVPADLGSGKEIEYATGVYFHPGNYTLALIAFESNGSRISVAHRDVRVEAVKDDPFPEVDRYVPLIELPQGFPDQEVGADDVSDGELFPVAHIDNWVPIANQQPVLVDVVLNFTKRAELRVLEPYRMDPRYPRNRTGMVWNKPVQPTYRLDVGRVLQMGNVLAHIGLSSGCVRVSAIDVLRMKTIVDRANEKTLDWDKFQQQIGKFDQNTVDAGVLANKKGPAQFAHRFLDTLSGDSTGCPGAARHYVVVIGHEVSLPGAAKEEKLESVDAERARFYYVHGGVSSMGDDLGEILKGAKPEKLPFTTPKDFRKSFKRIVDDLRTGK
jgi:hypothetical protein